ncbi:MAG: YecA family protein [Hyphomicrobiales bacterium]|nr:MAG: YecA family protein [Hyphomicrobiales bacterium]
MTSELTDLPESLVRLDDLLTGAGEDAMLLSELDGFLCCLAVGPEPIARSEWWPFEWLADERGMLKAGNEELDNLIAARLAEIEGELDQGQYAPLYEVDEETDEVVWEAWMAGFQQAMLLRFDFWDELLRDTEDDVRGEAAMLLASGLMLSSPDNLPDDTAGDEEWAEYDEAMEAMPEHLAVAAMLLYQLHHAA